MNQRWLPQPPTTPMPFPGPYHLDGDLWWLHGLFTMLVLVAIVVGVVLIVRMYLHRPTHHSGWARQSPALTELELRYARGELDRNDYLQRRADLTGGWAGGSPSSPPPAAAPPPPAP